MFLGAEPQNPAEIGDRLRDAYAVTAEFLSDIIRKTCRRFPSTGQSGKTARIERLIQSGAWTDAALALIDLELPQCSAVSPMTRANGIARCRASGNCRTGSINRSRPATDLALAILSAFVEVQRISAPLSRPSVPVVRADTNPLYEPVCSDNFA